MDPVQVSANADKVPALRSRGNIDELVMVFASLIISVIRAAKIDQTWNANFRSDLIVCLQNASSTAHLKPNAIERVVAEHRSKRTGYSLVFYKAAAPAARINQAARVEGVPYLA